MSETILSGDFTVYYDGDTGGDKQIKWTGTSGTYTVRQLYSAVQDLFDNVTAGAGDHMSTGVPFKAITPRQFQIGRIENNDETPWFIDPTTIEHLIDGSIETLDWTRTGTIVGIVKVQCSSTAFGLTSSDVGDTCTHSDADSGTILYVDTTNYIVWIRPDDTTAANNFDSTSGTITADTSSNVATQTAASTTGENYWTNIKTIGTIQGTESIFVAQDQAIYPSFWPAGHINHLFLFRDQGTIIDNGYFSVYIRDENKFYDNFLIDASDGGQNIVPLTLQDDPNNQTAGPIAANGITITFGAATADVNNDTTNEDYSIEIDANGQTAAYLYEYLKYILIEGTTSTTNTNGVQGQQFQGIDYKITYASETNTVNVGDEITGNSSGATGFVASKNTTGSYITLHNSQGTFTASENLTIGAASLNSISNITPISPTKTAPFGTFAGGIFFGSFGVLVSNIAGTDVNKYKVIADDGVTYEEPTQRTYTITKIRQNTEVRIYTDPGLVELAGREDVGGTPDGGDNNFTQSGPDADGLYSLSYNYTYGTAPVATDTDILVVAHNVDYQYVRLSATLINADGSLQLAQVADRQYI